MRSFEERKAELLRRQELYWEEQKRKKNLVKNCISGVMCIVILGVVLGEYALRNPYAGHYTIVNACTKSSYYSSVEWDSKICIMQSNVETYIYNENTGTVQMVVCSFYESDSGQLEVSEDVGNTYPIAEVTCSYYADGVEVDTEVVKP